MLGSIDCMHWSWKNCHVAWHGQFKGYKKDSTIVFEAVANYETWICQVFFEITGSYNDINVPHLQLQLLPSRWHLPKVANIVKPVYKPSGK
jgi:hypothetical protein